MRIAYIGEGHDFLGLMSVLGQYDHHYHCINDHGLRPATAKSAQLQQISMQRLFSYAAGVGCDAIIVSPEYEQYATQQENISCLSLFGGLVAYAREHTIVNKLGLIGDAAGQLVSVEKYVNDSYDGYVPVYKQSNNKHYHVQPRLTTKPISQMKYHMLTYGKQDRLMRKSWKFELRSFKDAAIDTLIPATYSMLHREKILRHHLSRKKITIVGSKHIQEIFEKETKGRESDYSITIHSTDPEGFENTFLSHKKWQWMLQRGKNVGMKFEKIE